MLGSPILYLKGMRAIMFQLSGFYSSLGFKVGLGKGGLGSALWPFLRDSRSKIWEFPKIWGTLFWGPYNRDPTIWGTILGFPIFGNSHN